MVKSKTMSFRFTEEVCAVIRWVAENSSPKKNYTRLFEDLVYQEAERLGIDKQAIQAAINSHTNE